MSCDTNVNDDLILRLKNEKTAQIHSFDYDLEIYTSITKVKMIATLQKKIVIKELEMPPKLIIFHF